MRRTAYVTSLALAVLLLSACVGSPAAVETPQVTPEETPGTEPATPGAATPGTATPTIDPDDSSSWLLSDAGMGPFVLGMPFAGAISAAPGLEDACGHAYHRGNELWIARGANTADPLAIVAWWGPGGPQTAEGIGVGSTTRDVLAAFPEASLESYNSYYLHTGNMFFQFTPSDDELDDRGQFVDDGTPKAIGSVAVTERGDLLWEYCG